MEYKLDDTGAFTAVVEEAVAQYEGGEPAHAIAYVVNETDNAERINVLDAIAQELDPADLGRLEQRELFLIKRQRTLAILKRRMGDSAAHLLIAVRR